MSQPSLVEQSKAASPKQKQKTSVYTVMLFIAFVSIIVAASLLYKELTYWGTYPWWKTTDAQPSGAAFIYSDDADSRMV